MQCAPGASALKKILTWSEFYKNLFETLICVYIGFVLSRARLVDSINLVKWRVRNASKILYLFGYFQFKSSFSFSPSIGTLLKISPIDRYECIHSDNQKIVLKKVVFSTWIKKRMFE